MEEKYWLVVRSSVFIWKKGSLCYWYDSESFASHLFTLEDTETEEWIDRLLDMDNLYSILLSGTELKKEKTQTFLRPLLSLGMIRLVEWTEGAIKPIQFPPILNLQADVERAKKDGNSSDSYKGENVLLNLQSLQIDFPASGDTFLHEALCRLFDSLRKVFLYEIAFTGYRPVFNRAAVFWQLMREAPSVKKFQLLLSDVSEEMAESLRALELPEIQIRLVIPPGFSPAKLEKMENLFSFARLTYEFQIFEETDCEPVDAWLEGRETFPVRITPCFNGNNRDFFKKHVYIGEETVRNSRQTKQHIFAHQALNSNDFGRLRISADGKVYANIHFPPLGTVADDIRWLVYKEMMAGTSWRRIRNTKPCSDCVYQWLCPSPSDYELEIGYPDLCFKNSEIRTEKCEKSPV